MLPGMELRQLRYFVAVAEEGNISRAAKRIFLTQPALSRQIKALEDEIGQCLLERQAHSIRLTPVGEALLREARELLQHAEQVLERVRAAGRGAAPARRLRALARRRDVVRRRRELHPDAPERPRGVVRPFDRGNAGRTGKRQAGCRAQRRATARNAGIEMDAARPRTLAACGEPKSSARPAVAGDAGRSGRRTLARLLPARLS